MRKQERETRGKKLNWKGAGQLLIVIIIAAGILAVGVGYWIATGGLGGGPTGLNVSTVTSLDYTVDTTVELVTGTQTSRVRWRAKNIGTSNCMLRIDTILPSASVLILNGVENKVWSYDNAKNQWTNLSAAFHELYQGQNTTLQEHLSKFSGWTGGEVTHTNAAGVTSNYYDIKVNLDLSDNLFHPS